MKSGSMNKNECPMFFILSFVNSPKVDKKRKLFFKLK